MVAEGDRVAFRNTYRFAHTVPLFGVAPTGKQIVMTEYYFSRFENGKSIVVFGAVTVADIILQFIPVIGWVLAWIIGVGAFILWIVLMVKAYQGQMYKLPVAGNIAEQQTKPKK